MKTAQSTDNGRNHANHFDVAILGTGMAGTMLGAILAKHGKRVLLIDSASHPRFAVGESTVPATSRTMIALGARYGIPEIAHLAAFETINKHVSSACGIKQNFGFVMHHLDGTQHPDETTQVALPGGLIGFETHLFRQDIDEYLLRVAVQYGAAARQQLNITEVDIHEQGVELTSSGGERFHARFVVDGSGYRSPLVKKFGLREEPSRLRHFSRSVFTHMIDVRHYDDCIHPRGSHGNPSPWCRGTLHHMFPGGWIWVIPFDNHPRASNPLCSVGATVDPRMYPKNGLTPEEDFFSFVNRFPSVAEQFRSARAVREWVSTDRLQYSSTRTVGYRFSLLAHASGFIDPLFSRGLAHTSDVVNITAHRLLAALEEDDFSVERFEYVERLNQNMLDCNDTLVRCSFVAFQDFNLWNAWFRIWALGQALGEVRLVFANLEFEQTGDPAVFAELEKAPYPGLLFPLSREYKELWDFAVARVDEVEAGTRAPGDAAEQIWEYLEKHFSDPIFMGIHQRPRRHIKLDPLTGLKGVGTLLLTPPDELRSFFRGGLKLLARRMAQGRRL